MFYMNMLREQDELMGNTGFDPDMVVNSDDKYAIDLKDIAKAVEDINDEYADESEQVELDGQDLHEDPVAECMIAIYESEHNWNQVLQIIGTHEVLEAARGREMVMEAVDIKSFIDKAKEFFVTQFKKISDAVKNFIEDTASFSRTAAAFNKKYGSKLNEGRAAYEKAGKTMKGYNYSTELDAKVEESLIGRIRNTLHTIKTTQVDSVGAKDFADIGTDNYIDQIIDKGNESAAKAMKNKLCGEKGTLNDATLSNVSTVLTKGPARIKEVRAVYVEIKKMFNEILKKLNELKKSVDKADKKSEAMGNLTKYINNMKKTNNDVHAVYAALMSAMRGELLQAMRIAHAWAAAAKKDSKKEDKPVKTESAGFFNSLELL